MRLGFPDDRVHDVGVLAGEHLDDHRAGPPVGAAEADAPQPEAVELGTGEVPVAAVDTRGALEGPGVPVADRVEAVLLARRDTDPWAGGHRHRRPLLRLGRSSRPPRARGPRPDSLREVLTPSPTPNVAGLSPRDMQTPQCAWSGRCDQASDRPCTVRSADPFAT